MQFFGCFLLGVSSMFAGMLFLAEHSLRGYALIPVALTIAGLAINKRR